MDLGDLFDLDVYHDLAESTLAMDPIDGMVFMNTYVGGPEGSGAETLFRQIYDLSQAAGKPVAARRHLRGGSSRSSRCRLPVRQAGGGGAGPRPAP
jgi:hypothetical protein